MKTTKLLGAAVMLTLTTFAGIAQNIDPGKPGAKDIIPFGKKLPPPDIRNHVEKYLPQMISTNADVIQGANIFNPNAIKKNPQHFKKLMEKKRLPRESLQEYIAPVTGESNEGENNLQVHLVKDIDSLAESNPYNSSSLIDLYDNISSGKLPYAVLDHMAYFIANDGIHGNELWRSDGTAGGTYMVKDITPGSASTFLSNITSLNGKIYFSDGSVPWVSDGTESGTQILTTSAYGPTEFFKIGKKVYFIASGNSFWSAIWKTDGTTAGTKLVIDIGAVGSGGEQILQPTVVNDLLFFVFIDYGTLGWQIWKSDLTDAGTYHVGPSYPVLDSTFSYFVNNTPAQLTNYNNKLYFSANDGSGRKLWVSDGTDAGTKLAPGNHHVIVDADYLGTSFPVLNNVLYVPGGKAPKGSGLYKYDASDGAGLVKIKDFAPDGDSAFIVPSEMLVIKNKLYFKVANYTEAHDELWSSEGCYTNTKLVKTFLPQESINTLYDDCGTLYFVKYDKMYGTELWKSNGTDEGTKLVSNVFKGATSSFPAYLTAFYGKLFFTAADAVHGNEIFITDGTDKGTRLVKDINTVTTPGSNAGFSFFINYGFNSMEAIKGNVLFGAYDRIHGNELYKSNGTAEGTFLLNEILPGEAGYPEKYDFITKDNEVYFLATDFTVYSIYKTDGTKQGLRKVTPEYGNIQSYGVADNGLVFYVVYNSNTGLYELWRTNGTNAGTVLLSSALYSSNYLNIIGNTAVFVAGDAVNGYELWRSDGSVAGTQLVKDINPGVSSGVPGGMFKYKNELYFAAYDSTTSFPSFWKTNGRKAGTIKLKNIDPWWSLINVPLSARYFCVSNNILYFSAVNHSNDKNTVFWKTDGTPAGTQPIKDINPTDVSISSGPLYLTDVNGTIFFTVDDGVHGRELWKSDGTTQGTQLVKDITPESAGSSIAGLTSFEGKLFFKVLENKDGFTRYYLWASDGTAEGTYEVDDGGIMHVSVITPAGNKLFLTGYTDKLGAELYVGKMDDDGKFVVSKISNEDAAVKRTIPFNAVLYPNPAVSKATLQITGNTKNVFISITDINGKTVWQSNNSNLMLVNLPTEKYVAGVYFVTVTSGKESKTIKLVKQ